MRRSFAVNFDALRLNAILRQSGTPLAASLRVSRDADVPTQLSENLESVGGFIERERRKMSAHQRTVEALTRALARPAVLYALVAASLVWIAYNQLAFRYGWVAFDRAPFGLLQTVLSVYAAVVTTAVLISQRRLRDADYSRGEVEFHVNLLAEQKVTKIIALLEELRRDLPNVPNRTDPVAEVMQEEIDPQVMHSVLSHE